MHTLITGHGYNVVVIHRMPVMQLPCFVFVPPAAAADTPHAYIGHSYDIVVIRRVPVMQLPCLVFVPPAAAVEAPHAYTKHRT
jgi:uncharacterized membrane protein YqgA involved in biofilm formation